MQKKIATHIVRTLQNAGYQAVFAGGCVRDLILKEKENDIDIATDAVPETIENLFKKTVAIGKSFGVIQVIENNLSFDVATFRKDSQYSDGRHPNTVTYTSMEEDAKRRDFTINGLFYDPIKNTFFDYVGGLEDIKKKVIRFIGDPFERIKEDNLRILRGARFCIKFNFSLEKKSEIAIKTHTNLIHNVSMERISNELIKMIKLGNPRKTINTLLELELLKEILPEVDILKTIPQNPKFHPEGDALEHTIRVMEHLVDKSLVLQFAGLLHDIGKAQTTVKVDGLIKSPGHEKISTILAHDILTRLKFSNQFCKDVEDLILNHMKMIIVPKMKKSKQKRFFSKENFPSLLQLYIADKKGGSNDLTLAEKIQIIFNSFEKEELKPKELITGKDLILLGYNQGKIIGDLKTEIYDLQLEGILQTKKQAIRYAKHKLEEK